MSIWDRADLNATAKDSDSKFLSKALGDGDSMTLTLLSIQQKERGPETKVGKPGDLYFEISLADENGKERTMEQNTNRGTFIVGMKSAAVEIGDSFVATRRGVGKETTYEVAKVAADGQPEAKPVAAPF